MPLVRLRDIIPCKLLPHAILQEHLKAHNTLLTLAAGGRGPARVVVFIAGSGGGPGEVRGARLKRYAVFWTLCWRQRVKIDLMF